MTVVPPGQSLARRAAALFTAAGLIAGAGLVAAYALAVTGHAVLAVLASLLFVAAFIVVGDKGLSAREKAQAARRAARARKSLLMPPARETDDALLVVADGAEVPALLPHRRAGRHSTETTTTVMPVVAR